MLTKGLRIVHVTVRLAWLAGTIALLSLIVLPSLLPVVGRQVYVVRGASMEPAIPLGAAVVVQAVDPADVTVGEVVTFRLPHGTVVTHRVTAITTDGGLAFQTKGDASAAVDPVLMPASEVVGGVEYTLPGVGFLLAVIGSAPGAFVAVGFLGSLLMLAWLIEELLATRHRSLMRATVAGQVR